MTETDDTPAVAPRALDIRVTAAKDSGFILHDMAAPEGQRTVAAFTDWRDCLEALSDLLSAADGESPGAANGNGRERRAGLWRR